MLWGKKNSFFWGLKMMTWQVTSPLVPKLSRVRIRKTPIVVTFSSSIFCSHELFDSAKAKAFLSILRKRQMLTLQGLNWDERKLLSFYGYRVRFGSGVEFVRVEQGSWFGSEDAGSDRRRRSPEASHEIHHSLGPLSRRLSLSQRRKGPIFNFIILPKRWKLCADSRFCFYWVFKVF